MVSNDHKAMGKGGNHILQSAQFDCILNKRPAETNKDQIRAGAHRQRSESGPAIHHYLLYRCRAATA